MSKLPHTSRRIFLRSAAACLALPALESVTPKMASAALQVGAQAVPTAKRMVCIGNSFGMYQPKFFPKTAGRDYELPALLAPLERHRADFSVFSNVDHGIKGGHFAVHSFLSGVRQSDAKAMPDGNISLDQRVAEVLGAVARFPSLTIGSTTGLHGGCSMAWTRTGVRVPPIPGPRELFRVLFENEGEAGRARAKDQFRLQGSILDAIRGDAKRLGQRVSGRDREKLDEYFSSVRDVERRIQQREQWYKVPKPTPNLPEPNTDNIVDDLPELYDLIAIALEVDATRVATLELSGAQFSTSILGLSQGYHALSHHGKDPKNIAGLVKLEHYQMQHFSKFLDRLKASKDVEGRSLFDQTAVLFGSGMGNANAHTNTDLPILLAGGGYKLGEHRVLPKAKNKRVPLCNLYLSLLQRMGAEDERFGTSSGTFPGLEREA